MWNVCIWIHNSTNQLNWTPELSVTWPWRFLSASWSCRATLSTSPWSTATSRRQTLLTSSTEHLRTLTGPSQSRRRWRWWCRTAGFCCPATVSVRSWLVRWIGAARRLQPGNNCWGKCNKPEILLFFIRESRLIINCSPSFQIVQNTKSFHWSQDCWGWLVN